ncbi:hypothetical protein [Desulfohalovibrio reitneri]|uniref:hypothetical protein n=1 Tax=Desulfohalovibrio reitneri TaxID=1307759 RepID=UPI0004A7682A|nr:hypothetical protein [Desulfohalovibrio reitneri]
MLKKPGEAKFKFCPLLKTSDDKLKFCQGPDCMMWRYADPAATEADSPGYCGLAGTPVRLSD